MITAIEAARIKAMKALVMAGHASHVTAEEKQWLLDTLAREHLPIRADVRELAANSGFDVSAVEVL